MAKERQQRKEKYHVRTILVLMNCIRLLLRKLMIKIAEQKTPRGDHKWEVNDYLRHNRRRIERKIMKIDKNDRYRYILYPRDATMKTDVGKWDLTLYTFLLIEIVMVEGKIKKNLQTVFGIRDKICRLKSSEVTRNVWKGYRKQIVRAKKVLYKENNDEELKNRVERRLRQIEKGKMKRKDINDVLDRWKKLECKETENSTGSGKTGVDRFYTVETMLSEVCCQVMQAVVRKRASDKGHRDLGSFLRQNKPRITRQIHAFDKWGRAGETLFPRKGETKIEDWEISLLCWVLLNVCYLGEIEVDGHKLVADAIGKFRSIRNETTHLRDRTLSQDKYDSYMEDMQRCVRDCLDFLQDDELSKDINSQIEDILNGDTDKEETMRRCQISIKKMRTEHESEKSHLEDQANIQRELSKIVSNITGVTLPECQLELMIESCGERCNQMLSKLLVEKINKAIKYRTASTTCNDKMETATDDSDLTTPESDDIEMTTTASEDDELTTALVSLIDTWKSKGWNPICSTQGSVLLQIHCTNFYTLSELYKTYKHDGSTLHVSEVQDAVQRLTGDRVKLRFVMYDIEMFRCMEKIVSSLFEKVNAENITGRSTHTNNGSRVDILMTPFTKEANDTTPEIPGLNCKEVCEQLERVASVLRKRTGLMSCSIRMNSHKMINSSADYVNSDLDQKQIQHETDTFTYQENERCARISDNNDICQNSECYIEFPRAMETSDSNFSEGSMSVKDETEEIKQQDCYSCKTVRSAQFFCEQCRELFCNICNKLHISGNSQHQLVSVKQRITKIMKEKSSDENKGSRSKKIGVDVFAKKQPEKDCPTKPRASDILADSITLSWDPPSRFCKDDYYQVSFKELDLENKWKSCQGEFKSANAVLSDLKSNTAFIFRVRVVYEDGEGPFSDESDKVVTSNLPASRMVKFSTVREKENPSPTKYALPITKERPAKNARANTRTFEVGSPPIQDMDSKTIMLAGASGCWKSTFVDRMANYVKLDDPFRFTVMDSKQEEKERIKNQGFISETDEVPNEICDDPYTRFLYAKALQDGIERDRCIRINVVGNFGQGKTTLIRRLVGQSLESVESTNGIGIDRYSCKQAKDGTINCIETDADDDSNIFDRLCLIAGWIQEDQKDNNEHESETDVSVNGNIQTRNEQEEVPVKPELNEEFLSFLHHREKANRGGVTNADREKAVTFDIWDFAGQYTFYATHTIFHSRNAIYILVMNLSNDFESIIYDDEFPAETGDRNMEYFIKFWMNSIHSFCGSPTDSYPSVILVGTHKDRVPGDTKAKQLYIDTYFGRVRTLFDNTDVLKHIHTKNFAVDCTVSTDTDIEALKNEIIQIGREKNSKEVLIPAKWILLENALIKRRNENIITFDEIMRIDAKNWLPLKEEEQIKMFLQYHHSKGTLLYFDEEPVSKIIVINPQYLIDAFKCIITSARFCKRDPLIRPLWNRLLTEAILENDLIDFQWKMHADQRFMDYREILLSFLVKHHIISEVYKFDEQCQTAEEIGCYIIPSLLKTRPSQQVVSDFISGKNRTFIRIALLFDNSSVVPIICQRLFAAALGKWPVASYHTHCLLFEDFAAFRLDMYQIGILQMNIRDRTIELQVLGLAATVYIGDTFRRFTEAVINHEFRRLAKEDRLTPYTRMFRCNDQSHGINGSKLAELTSMNAKQCVSCPDLENHTIPTTEAKSEWFLKDKISKDEIPKNTLSVKQLSKVSMSIGNNWEMLGLALGLSAVQIEHITEENPTAVMKRYTLLLTWQAQQRDKATIVALVKAMQESPGLTIEWDIIRNVIEELKYGNASSMP